MARGEVRYRLALETKAFTDGIKAAKQEAASLGNDLAGKLGKAGSVLQAMGPAGMVAAAGIGAATVAIGAVVTATISAAKAAADYADNLAALETKTGLSTDALQKLEIAAKLGNSSIEALAAATNKMQKGIVDGNENFKKLGLSLSDLKRMSPEEQLKATARAIDSIRDPAQKTAAAMAIFGKSGTDVIGSLKALSDGSADMAGALDQNAIRASAETADALDLMGVAMDRAWRQFGAAVAGSPEVQQAIKDITQAFVDLAVWLQKHGPEIKAFFGIMVEGAMAAGRAITGLVSTFAKLNPGLGVLGNLVGGTGAGQYFDDKLKAARQGSGVSSGGVQILRKGKNGQMVPDGPNFTGAADDKAAKEAARAEMERIEAVKKARIEEHKTRLKMQDEIDKRQQLSLQNDLKRMQEAAGAKADLLKDQEAKQMEQDLLDQATQDDLARMAAQAHAAMISDINSIASSLLTMGATAKGAFGVVLSLAGGAVNVFTALDKKTRDAMTTTQKWAGVANAAASIMQGPGGMKGAMSGAMQGASAGAAFGPMGALIGGGAGALLGGLFGGPSEAEKAAERKKKIDETIGQMEKLGEKIRGIKLDHLNSGIAGLGSMFGYLAGKTDVSTERLERLGRFGMDMLKRLRAEGMSTVEAFKLMGPALDKALEAWKKSGKEMSGAFAEVLAFRQKVLDNEGTVNAAEGFNDIVKGMPLNKDSIVDVQAELKAMYDDLIGKGFTANEALGLLAPTLLRIRDALRDGKITADEFTTGLVTGAEAGGHFEGLKDPMKELVEVQKMMLELWAAIAKMQGVTLPESLRAYVAELNNARNAMPGVPGAPSGGGKYGGEPEDTSGPEGATHSAGGFWNPNMPHGPLAGGGTNLVVHPGEEVSVTPRGRKGGGMGNVVLNVDGRAFARVQNNNTRKNRGGARSQGQRFIGQR